MNVLESTKQAFEARAKSQAEQLASRMEAAREMVIRIATGGEPQPSADEILDQLDAIGADPTWLADAVDRCQRRIVECEGLEKVAPLKAELSGLQKELDDLMSQLDDLKEKVNRLFNRNRLQASPNAPSLGDLQMFWRRDLTRQEMAEFRDAERARFDALDDIFFLRVGIANLQTEIKSLETEDAKNIDHRYTAPHDFRLPSLEK